MTYKQWYKQRDRYIFLLDIFPKDGEFYGVCYGWFIVEGKSLLNFQDNFGVPTDWAEDIEPIEYFSSLTEKHRRKMIQDLFERVIN